jgi:hypothetical protein
MRTAVAVAALVLVTPAAHGAQAPSYVVQADARIGHFAVKRDGTLGGAQRAFGAPSSLRRTGESCVANWRAHTLTIFFYNLGGQNPCTARHGFFSRAVMGGTRWRTAKGLRIGQPVSALRRLYPDAEFRRGLRGVWPSGWWLVTRRTPFGLGGSYPGLLATTRQGLVNSLQVRYPAGGD